MKNNKIQFCSTLICFFVSFIAFAEPGDESEDGGMENADGGMPINSHLIWLLLAGVLFAWYTLKKHRDKQIV
jgi:hypothetical protein